jgi:hypothetical protein
MVLAMAPAMVPAMVPAMAPVSPPAAAATPRGGADAPPDAARPAAGAFPRRSLSPFFVPEFRQFRRDHANIVIKAPPSFPRVRSKGGARHKGVGQGAPADGAHL